MCVCVCLYVDHNAYIYTLYYIIVLYYYMYLNIYDRRVLMIRQWRRRVRVLTVDWKRAITLCDSDNDDTTKNC